MQPQCSIPDCERVAWQRGWCQRHYGRWWRNGSPLINHHDLDEDARFWSKVNKTTDCWLWTGTILKSSVQSRNGYGLFHPRQREGSPNLVYAHRYAYEAIKGPIPAGLQIDHLCRVHNCVNPDHLEAVTQLENMRRGREARALVSR